MFRGVQAEEEQIWIPCGIVFKYPGCPEAQRVTKNKCAWISKGQSGHVTGLGLYLEDNRKPLTVLIN